MKQTWEELLQCGYEMTPLPCVWRVQLPSGPCEDVIIVGRAGR